VKNVDTTILAQYSNSPSLVTMIEEWNACLDPGANLTTFYYTYWNLLTASGQGLDTWGVILGVSRELTIVPSDDYFGFYTTNLDWEPWGTGGQAPFFNGSLPTETIALPDDQYLQLLLTKAAANICQTTIPALNRLIQSLFGSFGPCYVQDLGNMQMAYVFGFTLTPVQTAIVTTSGVLPHPTGVAVSIVVPP
jgi:hypothetical protein